MRGGLLLMTLLLIVKLHHSLGGCDEHRTRRSTSENIGSDKYKRSISKRYSDLDYDSFVGLMGRRNAEPDNEEEATPQKREMHDIFVGLLGRRNSESGNGPWRRDNPERRGIFLNKCRLRLLQGL
ncbi:tachykinin-3a isoform X2 [Gouania willdenowi]|uniref:tachykinin-3a isoform X2 n=1 Tax=Gouania willdenowi TaxID=441366 RepID=UPI0010551272|nr:tachykinin-3-like isoform X2 [Gouania willdenowi]